MILANMYASYLCGIPVSIGHFEILVALGHYHLKISKYCMFVIFFVFPHTKPAYCEDWNK